jgi:hypothetical protein
VCGVDLDWKRRQVDGAGFARHRRDGFVEHLKTQSTTRAQMNRRVCVCAYARVRASVVRRPSTRHTAHSARHTRHRTSQPSVLTTQCKHFDTAAFSEILPPRQKNKQTKLGHRHPIKNWGSGYPPETEV